MAAMAAAQAGVRVLVLEAGAHLTSAEMTQREEQMFPRLFWDSGGRTTADRAVKVHQGRGVGGSTLHNLNLCKRIPAPIFSAWRRDVGLSKLAPELLDGLYDEVERLLEVSEVEPARWNRHNRLLSEACEQLGWRGGALKHNRTGCTGSGFCEVGCAFDAKNNAAKVLVPALIRAGGEVLVHCQAVRLSLRRGEVAAVDAVALDAVTRRPIGTVHVRCKRVCLSASATGTPALLLRSGVLDAGGLTGNRLRVHPAVIAAGDFDEPVRAWEGIPQSYECTELLELGREGGHRTWIVPAFAHPVGTATLIPGHGAAHHALMHRYPHLGVFTAMIHDLTAGQVRPDGDLGVSIDYWPGESDRQELAHGLWACATLLFAAGAREIFVPTNPPWRFGRGDDLGALKGFELTRGALDVVAVHPMGSVPMGDDPERSAVDSEGRHHAVKNLFVADGSLFPSSIGGPPQLSIYALGLHVGRAIARS
ncbi:MAG: GMC family oxidoreductase [Archangiaceae bacterium]|nr:GMC family oxidoreductase [Archangiaceae bacterium]